MTIRNLRQFVDRLWNWGWLRDCFSGGIGVTDLDGVVERNGHFLFLEGKGPNASVPNGQARMFNALQETLGARVTIVIVRGDPSSIGVKRCQTCGMLQDPPTGTPTIQSMQVWPKGIVPADASDLHAFVQTWYDHANQRSDS